MMMVTGAGYKALRALLVRIQKERYHEPNSDHMEYCAGCGQSPYNVPQHKNGCPVVEISRVLKETTLEDGVAKKMLAPEEVFAVVDEEGRMLGGYDHDDHIDGASAAARVVPGSKVVRYVRAQ